MNDIHRTLRRNGWLTAAFLVLPLSLAGCYSGFGVDGNDDASADDPDEPGGGPRPGDDGGEPVPLEGPDECVDTKKFFEEEVWRPVLKAQCLSCHNDNGEAKNTDLILRNNDYPGYLEANYNTLLQVSRLSIDGEPLVLAKPTLSVEHGGGKKLEIDSAEYEALAEMVERFDSPVHCVNDKEIEAYFQGIVEADEVETLRKATFLLASRMPTPEEIEAVRGQGIDAIDPVLDEVMREDAFYTRVKEMYNDWLHTDAYLPGDDALELLDPERFPNAMFYMDLPEDQQTAARDAANDAIAREPLNIIEHVLRTDHPFSEILTANYTVVNPYSARAYDIPLDVFQDPNDPDEYMPYTLEGFPHAGILTTQAWLARYPNTDTNRNRARSRFVFQFFGGEDIQLLAARPIDITNVQTTNPTLFDTACVTCHDYMDPVAGAFANWSNEGWYRPQTWHGDMVPPGYKGEEIPAEETEHALQWLADKITRDDKFALSVVHVVYKGLTGEDPLLEPLDATDPFYVERIRAFEAQDYTFKEVAKIFQNSGYDFRSLVKAMIKTPWVRAVDLEQIPDQGRMIELETMGSSRVLSPEALDRKLVATMGFRWMRNGAPALLSDNNYFFFLGGIDSINVLERLTEMNGVMSNIAQRMANEMSCQATAWDFTKVPEERLLFPYAELTDTPDIAASETAILNNIQYLHEHMLGESLSLDDPEITRTFQVFKEVYEDGQAGLLDGDYGMALPGPCQATTDLATGEAIAADLQIIEDPDYTVRAWMAVVSYLLGDYKFLYE